MWCEVLGNKLMDIFKFVLIFNGVFKIFYMSELFGDLMIFVFEYYFKDKFLDFDFYRFLEELLMDFG